VELEVEEDGEAAMAEFLDDGVAFGEVEFEADFEPGAGVFELFHEREGWRGAGVVEGDDKAGGHRVQVTGYGLRVTGYRLQVTGYRVEGTGWRVQGGGYRGLVAGCLLLGAGRGQRRRVGGGTGVIGRDVQRFAIPRMGDPVLS
jgi:hypothetical protein